LKTAIVGADGTKWTKEQENKAKEIIRTIFLHLKQGWLIIEWSDTLPKRRKRIATPETIVLVSGHCPVGEERWYCVDCKGWFHDADETTKVEHLTWLNDHRMIKVYDEGGVDTWAEIIATELGIKKEIYSAEVNQWNDKWERVYEEDETGHWWKRIRKKGYRSRNIQIAETCDVLYDIEPKGSCKYCGGQGKVLDRVRSFPTFNQFINCRKCKGVGVYSGGTWTMRYAEKLGKEVHQVIIR